MQDFHIIKRKAVDHPPAFAHGPITPLFPDAKVHSLYYVRGRVYFGRFPFNRNMTINIHPITRDITIINSVRLSEPALKELESMGQIKHIIRLCAYHGMDDAFYIFRYQAKYWALKGMSFPPGLEGADYYMSESPDSTNPSLPIYPSASIFIFRHLLPHLHEANLIIHYSLSSSSSSSPDEKTTNILISGDSVQNYHYGYDPHTSILISIGLPFTSFRGTCIGPAWFNEAFKKATPSERREEFDRLLAFHCNHLIPPHGYPRLDDVDPALRKAVDKILTPSSKLDLIVPIALLGMAAYGISYFWKKYRS